MDWKIIFLVAWVFIKNVQSSKYPVHELDESSLIRCCNVPRRDLEIYCYSGHPKHLFHVWETVQLTISLNPDQYDHFEGYDAIDVTDKFENLKSTWNFNLFMYKRKFIKLNPVNRTCVGISSTQDYNLAINRIRVDFWKVLQSLIGLLLFITAPKLSSSSIFYYLTGISVGTFASILILIYILSRFMPKKPVMYSFLAGGWAVGLYMAQMVFDNIKTIVIEYKSYMIYYLLSTSIISFMICYKIGPVTDPKSINLIKWAMQSVGLILIFLSSDFQEASMTLVLALLLFYNLKTWISFKYFKKIKNWWKPPVPRLLTEDEYHQQGAIETEKALGELRSFCSSPDCNQWKTVLRLQKPARFAKFVEGGSHLEDDEVLAFHDEESKLSDSSSLISEDESD